MWPVSSSVLRTIAPSSCAGAAAAKSRARRRIGFTFLLLSSCLLAPAYSQGIQNAGPVVNYKDGLLTIDPHGSPLHDVLSAIRDRVGFTLDLPPRGMESRVLDEQIGPAPVKDVLVQLLYGCGANYIIQTASGTPQNVQRILVSAPSHGAGRDNLVAAAQKPNEDDDQEPPTYAGFIPANTSAPELVPVRPAAGQAPATNAANVPGIPTDFNLQQAAAEAHKTPGEILDELQKRQNEILDGNAQTPPQQ